MEWFASKKHRTESRFVIGPGKYTVCRRVRAIFSPEILQAWALKGLMVGAWILIHLHVCVFAAANDCINYVLFFRKISLISLM